MENENNIFSPTGYEPGFKKTAENLKQVNKEIKIQSEKDLKEVGDLIEERQKDILEQEEEVKRLKGIVKIYEEGDELGLKDAEELLKFYQDDLEDSLNLQKRIINLLNDAILSDVQVSAELEKLEKEITEFKEEILKRSENDNN